MSRIGAQLKSFMPGASARVAAVQLRPFQVGTAKMMFVAGALATFMMFSASSLIAADPPRVDLATWTPPDIGSVGDDPFGELVKFGHSLFTDTANQIGPTVADPAKR